MATKPKKMLVKFNRIWRNHSPGDIASFELAPRQADGNFFQETDKNGNVLDKKTVGDMLVEQMANPKYRTATKLSVKEALHHLGPSALADHGYTKEEVDAELAKATPELKAIHAKYVAGEKSIAENGLTIQHQPPPPTQFIPR